MNEFNSSIFENENIAEAQRILSEQLKVIKETYFIQWQKIHPTSYATWLNDPEHFTQMEIIDLNNCSKTQIYPLPEDISKLDLFWTEIQAGINNQGIFPYIDDIPLYYFSTPIKDINYTPLQYLISGIDSITNKNIFVADLARMYNIDATIAPFDYNIWTVELIVRLHDSDASETTTMDKRMWLNRLIFIYYSSILRYNSKVTISWLASVGLQFIDAAPQHQASLEVGLRIIFKESYRLDADISEYLVQLLKNNWFNKIYTKRIMHAIKQYYVDSLGRDVIVRFTSLSHSDSSSSSPSSSSSSSSISNIHQYKECFAWRHDNFRVYWNESLCTCDDKNECLLKRHTIYTLQTCNCSPKVFCILRAVQNELTRLNLFIEKNVISL